MAKKLFIFDLDGTLCDTLPDVGFYVSHTLVKFGFKSVTKAQVFDTMCYSIEEIFHLLSGVKDVNDPIIKQMVNYYQPTIRESKSPRTRLYQGIDKLLTAIKNRGDYLAILTNKSAYEAEVVYDKLLKDFNFDKVVGLKEGIIPKPDPTEIYNLIKEFGVEKENTYFIGDGDTDVLASLNANVKLIAVTYGYRTKDFLKTLGAYDFADNPQQILEKIYD